MIENEDVLHKDPVNTLEVIHQHETFETLRDYCLEIISNEPKLFFASPKFPLLEKSIITMVLQRDDLNIKEIDIWDSLLRWLFIHNLKIDDDDSEEGHRDDTSYWDYDKINLCWRFVKCYPGNAMSKHYDARHVINVDDISLFTVMIYLSSNTDGALEFANGTIINPRPGRMVIFDHGLLHAGNTNTDDKYFIRSELMYTRSKPIETYTDKQALYIYHEALKLNSMDPQRAAEMEKEAFRLSPVLELLHLY